MNPFYNHPNDTYRYDFRQEAIQQKNQQRRQRPENIEKSIAPSPSHLQRQSRRFVADNDIIRAQDTIKPYWLNVTGDALVIRQITGVAYITGNFRKYKRAFAGARFMGANYHRVAASCCTADVFIWTSRV